MNHSGVLSWVLVLGLRRQAEACRNFVDHDESQTPSRDRKGASEFCTVGCSGNKRQAKARRTNVGWDGIPRPSATRPGRPTETPSRDHKGASLNQYFAE